MSYEEILKEKDPYVLSTLLMSKELGVEVSNTTLAILKMREEAEVKR